MTVSQHPVMIPTNSIAQRILVIRGCKVILDADLADLYHVDTKVLNQSVKRNEARFPSDFIFQLTDDEKTEVVTNCDHLTKLKFSHKLPYAFTEHGVAMLSSVLRSPQAVEINIYIIRAFIRLREILASDKELAGKILEIEREQKLQNKHINSIYSILDKLIQEPVMEPVTFADPIGFTRDS